MTVQNLPPSEADQAVRVLCDAFHDYPVMRFVLGPCRDYDRRLHTLVGFFVAARIIKGEPVLGALDPAGELTGVAIVSLPGEQPSRPALIARREDL